MATVVELPDKTEIEFPDGMDELAIHREITKAFPDLGKPVPSERASIPEPSEAGTQLKPPTAPLTPLPQAFPAKEQAITETARAPRTPVAAPPPSEAQQQTMLTGVAQPEAEIQPIGEEGTFLRGATSVGAAVLNRPEYLAAMLNPATAAAVGIRFAPGVAKQFVEDLGKASQGDNEALGRAAAVGVPALFGVVKSGKTVAERLNAQAQLEKAISASNAAHIDSLAREALQPQAVMEPSRTAVLPETQAELNKLPGGPSNASSEQKTAEVGGSVLRPSEERPAASGMPVDESSAGVRAGSDQLPQIEREQQPQPATQEVSPVRDVAEPNAVENAILDAIQEGGMIQGIKKDGTRDGHYVVAPPETPEDTWFAVGPFKDKSAAQDFLDAEVGAPGAKIVQVDPNGKLIKATEPIKEVTPNEEKGKEILQAQVAPEPLPPQPVAEGGAQVATPTIEQPPAGKVEPAGAPEYPRPVELPRPGLPKEEREAEFQRYMADVDRHEAELKAWEASQPQNKPIIFKKGEGSYVAITKDPQGGWRATTFTQLFRDDQRIAPWGHERYTTRLQALKEHTGEIASKLPEVMTEEEIKARTKPPEPPTTPKAEAKAKRGIERPEDIIDVIKERFGTIRRKSAAKPGTEGYYTPEFVDLAKSGASRDLFGPEGQSPDEVVDALRREGYLGKDATVDDLRVAIERAKAQRRAIFRGETPEIQSDKFQAALKTQGAKKSSHILSVGDLGVGDKFRIAGEELEVVSIDPDTGEVTVKDGRKFGYQTIPDGADVPIEKGSLDAKAKVPAFTKEDFALNAPESVEQQKARLAHEEALAKEKADREKIEAAAAKPLVGSRGDIGQGDLLGGGDLFSGPSPIGMGGAVPSEFVPSAEGATAMKYRKIDAERIKRGLEPLAKPDSVSDQVTMDRAMAAIDADPYLPEKLTAELIENPRTIEDWENHVLLLRKIDLRNEYAKATRDIQQAAADGRTEDVRLAQQRRAEWSAKLTDLEIASRLSGSARGRALRALRVMANEDYSLAQMEAEMSANRDGRPISESERAELAAIEKRYNEAQGKIKELEEVAKQREELLKQSELARSVAEAKAAYDPRVLSVAEKFAGFMDKKAADAATRLREKLRNVGAGVDPTIVADLTVMAAAKITRGAVDFARWSAEVTKDFGDAVKPFLKDAWDAAKTQVAAELDKWAKPLDRKTAEKVKSAVTPATPKGGIEDITGKIRAKVEKDETAEIHPLARKLLRAVVEEHPTIAREEALTRVHDILKEVLPEITRQEASDAITGRGRFWQAAQDEISKTVRDLSTQMRLVSHQQDVLAKKPLPRTGFQPDPFSDAARREQQVLNELKRKFGVVVTDPTKQLASALGARKTYYRNRLADLRSEIASRERIVKTKTPSPTDAELNALKDEYAKVKADHDAIFGDRTLTDEQRLKMATAAAERNLAEWTQRLENAKKGTFGPTKTPGEKVSSAELEAIKAQAEAVKEQVRHLQDLANPKKSPAEIALQGYKTRTANQIAKLKEQIASGDFAKKAPKPVEMDKEATALQHELVLIKEARNEAMLKAKLRDEGPVRKLFRGGLEAVNATRAILTSIDFSAVLNQGKFIVVAHPVRGAKSIGPMLRSFASPKSAFEVLREIQNRPNYPLYKASKLFLNEPGGTLAQMEEAYMSRWAKKIPGVAGSERAYTTFLNKLRADSFDAMVTTLTKGKPSIEEAKVISNFINVATGRGTIGMADQAAVGLNTFFFAPRFVASRFQMALGQPIYAGLPSGKLPLQGTIKARALVTSEYARLLLGYSIIYGLAAAAGYKIGDDVRSSDFGKIILGNTRVDVLAGVSQVSVLLGREISGETKTLTGKVTPIRGPNVPYGGSTGASVAGNFLRTKLAPVPSIILDAATGKNVVGQPVTASDIALRSLVPITLQDIYQVMKENEMPQSAALSTLALFGERMQTYTPKQNQPIANPQRRTQPRQRRTTVPLAP